MEIHPPDHPVMTWKQFFVHMAIVVLGLLIAIGLEQSVEWLHERHESHQLVDDMREEAEENIAVIDRTLPIYVQRIDYDQKLLNAIAATKVENGKALVDLSPLSGSTLPGVTQRPSNATWDIAKAAGLIPLLSRQQALIFAKVDVEASKAADADEKAVALSRDLGSLELNATDPAHPGFLIWSPAQHDEAYRTAQRILIADRALVIRLKIWKGASEALVHNVPTVAAMEPYILHAVQEKP